MSPIEAQTWGQSRPLFFAKTAGGFFVVMANLQVVWFKKDLRIVDHQPLAQAAGQGPVLPLFIIEPDLWAQPDMSDRHWCFLRTCLEELK